MPGTSSHTKIALNGKGLKRVNSYGQGNHYINLKIAIPSILSAEQKALIQVNPSTQIKSKIEKKTCNFLSGIC